MISPTDYCLVIGAGSIGERYIRNLWALGFRKIVVLRKRLLPFRDIGAAQVEVVTSWEAVEGFRPRMAFVCTPTSMHMENAMECVQRSIAVLVEKPLSHTLDGLPELQVIAERKSIYVHIGYMMRFHPLLMDVQNFTVNEKFGKLIHMHSHWGEYLPDWHPWEDYRTSYAASKLLGGGVALTLSHDLDVANWLADAPIESVKKTFNFRSALEVDVESGADFLLLYKNGITAHVHLNYFQKVKERTYKYYFENALVTIDFFKSEMTIASSEKTDVRKLESFDRNQLFIDQIKFFIKSIEQPCGSQRNIEESREIIKLIHE